jgi:hypothetical protein
MYEMKKLVFILVLVVAILFIMPMGIVRADAEAKILQVYISEQTLTVFIDNRLFPNALKCSVSNQNAEITATGSLSDDNTLIKTIVLLDISTSMPAVIRDGVITSLKKMVEQKAVNEEFKLVVFGDEIKTLHDFSSDRYDLASAIEKIKFDGTQSKIYDAIYNTIPRIASFDKKPTFYRTIVITDGVDNTASGITKEELFLKLQSEHYPVDVITVSSKERAEDKELSAIVRMSGGKYYSLNPDTDIDILVQNLNMNGSFYFEAKIPSALLDGTIRQIDINDGVSKISLDVKIPVFNTPNVDTPTQTEPEEETPETSSTIGLITSPLPVETENLKSITTIFGDYTIVIFIGAGVALIILIAVIIAVLVTEGKKKKNRTLSEVGNYSGYKNENNSGKTEFIGDEDYSNAQYTIKLSSLNNPNQNWTLPINGQILIGRAEHCSVRLDDKSVSREQCKIIHQGSGLVIVHMGSSNKTFLNGSNVAESSPLQSGDTIKIGRETLRVDYIQTLGNPIPKSEPQLNSSNRNTECMF